MSDFEALLKQDDDWPIPSFIKEENRDDDEGEPCGSGLLLGQQGENEPQNGKKWTAKACLTSYSQSLAFEEKKKEDEALLRLRTLDEIDSLLAEERLQSYVPFKSRCQKHEVLLFATYLLIFLFMFFQTRAMRERDRYSRVQSRIKKLAKLLKVDRSVKSEVEILESAISHVVHLR